MPIERRTFFILYVSSATMATVAIALADLFRRLLAGRIGVFLPILLVLLIAFVFGIQAGLLARFLERRAPLPRGHFGFHDPATQRWIIVKSLSELGQWAWAPFSLVFFKPGIYAFFGANVGKNTAIAGILTDPSLTRIDDGAIIGLNAVLSPHCLTGEGLTLSRIGIGAGATVGVGAVLQGDVDVGPHAIIAANAVVTSGTRVLPGELWGGVPARKLKDPEP